MNPDESLGIKMVRKLVQCGAIKQLFTGDMQIYINTCTFNPVDVAHPNEPRRSTGLHHQAIKIAAGLRSGG